MRIANHNLLSPDVRLKALSSYTIVSSVVPYFGGPTMRYIYQVRENQREKTTLSQENKIHLFCPFPEHSRDLSQASTQNIFY